MMYAKFVQQSIEVPNEVDWTMPAQHERAPVLEVSTQVWDGVLAAESLVQPGDNPIQICRPEGAVRLIAPVAIHEPRVDLCDEGDLGLKKQSGPAGGRIRDVMRPQRL